MNKEKIVKKKKGLSLKPYFQRNIISEEEIKKTKKTTTIRGGIRMITKQQRKEIAWKEYEKIRDLAYKKYNKIIKLSYEKYQKVIEEIDNDPEEILKIIKEKGKCKNPSQNGEIIYLLSEKDIN